MEQTLLQTKTNSLILRLSASWPSCILRNKQWTWSCWKLASEVTRYHQCSDRRNRSDHFGWPRSPGNTGRDGCEIAQQKAGIFKKGKKAVVGPLSDDAIAVCQEKAEQLAVALHAFQKDFGLEQDRFGMNVWNLSCHLWA